MVTQMAAAFIFNVIVLVLSLFLTTFTQPPHYVDHVSNFFTNRDNFSDLLCGSSTCNRTHTAMFSLVAPAMFGRGSVLLLARPCANSRPFRPQHARSRRAFLMSLLLLSCGDVEIHPGPTIDRIFVLAL